MTERSPAGLEETNAKTKLMINILDRGWKPILLVVAIGLLAIIPALIFGSPSNQDLTHHFRLALHFYDSMRTGGLPAGWLASAASGYGDVTPRFYPPALYYLLAGSRLALGNWYNGALFTYAIISIVSALGTYVWAREFLPRGESVCAAALYTFAPYHLNQFYQAFLLAEFAGAAILPFTFAFVHRVCKRGRMGDVAGLAISYALLVLTHLPLTVIGSIALTVYALWCLDKKKLWPTLWKLAAAVGLGLAASASFWTTLVAELSWFGGKVTSSDHSTEYGYNFVFSTVSTDNLNVWWMNILTLATLALFLPALACGRARLTDNERRGVRGTLVLFLFGLIMTSYLSWPVWRLSQTLQSVQFPWRWLAVASLAGAVLAAAHLSFWLEKARTKARPMALLIGGGMAIGLAFALAHSVREAEYLPRTAFEERLQAIPSAASYDMWWPIWARSTAMEVTEQVQVPGRQVKVTSWQPLERDFTVPAGAPSDARVALFYYPYWVATATQGQPLPVRPAPDGTVLISVPAEATTVMLKFREPPRVRVTRVVGVIGWIAIAALCLIGRRKAFLPEETEETERMNQAKPAERQ
ncbi:MAG: 6-pyruvoyl-tetrahydropterin synthase-related protein [Pyrinomonadaceae bacterium]